MVAAGVTASDLQAFAKMVEATKIEYVFFEIFQGPLRRGHSGMEAHGSRLRRRIDRPRAVVRASMRPIPSPASKAGASRTLNRASRRPILRSRRASPATAPYRPLRRCLRTRLVSRLGIGARNRRRPNMHERRASGGTTASRPSNECDQFARKQRGAAGWPMSIMARRRRLERVSPRSPGRPAPRPRSRLGHRPAPAI